MRGPALEWCEASYFVVLTVNHVALENLNVPASIASNVRYSIG